MFYINTNKSSERDTMTSSHRIVSRSVDRVKMWSVVSATSSLFSLSLASKSNNSPAIYAFIQLFIASYESEKKKRKNNGSHTAGTEQVTWEAWRKRQDSVIKRSIDRHDHSIFIKCNNKALIIIINPWDRRADGRTDRLTAYNCFLWHI